MGVRMLEPWDGRLAAICERSQLESEVKRCEKVMSSALRVHPELDAERNDAYLQARRRRDNARDRLAELNARISKMDL